MVNLIGPGAFDCDRPAAVRPPFIPANGPGDQDDFWQDCTSPLARDGTELKAGWMNKVTELLRSLVRRSSIAADNLDDDLLTRAVRSQSYTYFAAPGGTANNLTVAALPTFAALSELVGVPLVIKLAAANTGAMTLTVDALAATPIVHGNGAAVAAADFPSGYLLCVAYDGTNFQVRGPARQALVNGEVFTASGNFTVPAGVSRVRIRAWGAGGGGGGITGNAAGGGGGGEYREGWFNVVPGAVHAVTIGAGGAGGTSAPTAGTAGGSTSVGSLITAVGGSPGQVVSTGGLGGTGGSGGSFNQNGGNGSNGGVLGANVSSGIGGGSWMVTNHYIQFNAGAGGVGLFYGQGGNGATGGTGAAAGGAGKSGLVIVEW